MSGDSTEKEGDQEGNSHPHSIPVDVEQAQQNTNTTNNNTDISGRTIVIIIVTLPHVQGLPILSLQPNGHLPEMAIVLDQRKSRLISVKRLLYKYWKNYYEKRGSHLNSKYKDSIQ